MASSRKTSSGQAIAEWLRRLNFVSEADWRALCAAFPGASASTLRKALKQSGLPLAPMVEGVRQESFDELARTLRALQVEYETAAASQDRERMRAVRARVIEAKTHARFAARREAQAEAREIRQTMIEWMLVWLNDPKLFDAWAKIALPLVLVAARNQHRPGQVADPDSSQTDSER